MAPDDVEMVRVSVQVPEATLAQIDEWAKLAGLKRGVFCSTALALGARILARNFSPEAFLTPEAFRAIAEGMPVREAV